tara:strand:- start:135 stop:560 length:426 start_codon:yes stop_codon:yes gene_type:complete
MPLIIGVENGLEKGFTENDLQLINGFPFGMIMMITNTGSIKDVEEFRLRALEANFMNEIFDKDQLRDKLTIDFVQRMKDADWSCNVGYDTKAQFKREIKRRLYEHHKWDFRDWIENRGKYKPDDLPDEAKKVLDTFNGSEE